jgi:hypothetical protein
MPTRLRLHIDESGGKLWPAPWGQNPDKHYVMVGLILDGVQIAEATEGVSSVLERHFPDAATRPSEIHYGDIINGRKICEKLTHEQRLALADDVFALIERISPVLMGTVIKKEALKRRYGERAHSPPRYALRATLGRFDAHLKGSSCEGDVVLDTAGVREDQETVALVEAIKVDGTRLSSPVDKQWLDSRLEKITGVTCVDSRSNRGIQLADFVAYATWVHFERGQSRRFDQLHRMWRTFGSFREPSVLPSWG